MIRFRRLPVQNVSAYIILDRGVRYPTDKEYIDLGVREGWLELFRIGETQSGSEYVYIYPASFECE